MERPHLPCAIRRQPTDSHRSHCNCSVRSRVVARAQRPRAGYTGFARPRTTRAPGPDLVLSATRPGAAQPGITGLPRPKAPHYGRPTKPKAQPALPPLEGLKPKPQWREEVAPAVGAPPPAVEARSERCPSRPDSRRGGSDGVTIGVMGASEGLSLPPDAPRHVTQILKRLMRERRATVRSVIHQSRPRRRGCVNRGNQVKPQQENSGE